MGDTEFSGTFSTYVTMIGYMVGMADIWRFPFLVYRNGGGAFLIPFVLTMVLCGVPMYFMEYSIAKFSGKGPYRIWDYCPLFRGVGLCIVLTYLVYVAGSTVFRGFLSIFLINSLKNPLPWATCDNPWNTLTCRENPFTTVLNSSSHNSQFMSTTPAYDTVNITDAIISNTTQNNTLQVIGGMTAAEEFWQYEALKLSSGLLDFSPFRWRLVIFTLIMRAIVLICAYKSIKSIEKVMYVTTFVPLLISVIIFIRSVTLPGAAIGLRRFYYPDFDKLTQPRVWIEAFLMSFYSLSFGWGGTLTLGSHAKFKENCIRNSIVVPAVDGIVGVVTSSVCFSVLGNMAYAYDVAIDDVINAGVSLGVVSYVTALSGFPVPQLWNFIFLFSALLVGLDSQVVPLELSVQVISEALPSLYPKYRTHTLVLLSLGLFVLSIPTCTGAGAYIFLWVDWYIGVWVGPIISLIEVITVAWVYGIDRFCADVSLMIGRPVPGFYRLTIAFVSPCIVITVCLTSIVEYVPPSYGAYVYPKWARGLGWLIVVLLMSPLAVKMVSMLKQSTGTLMQRIQKCTTYIDSWGPKEASVRGKFDKQQAQFQNRNKKQLIHYSVFGRYSEKPKLEEMEKELDTLVG